MKPKTCQLLLTLVTLLLLLLQKSLSYVNPNYVGCKLFECGSLNISYPFFVPDKQPPNCGSDGFQVSCNPENQTLIKLSGDEYIINSISYQDLTINITNSAFSSSAFGCSLSSVHNLTFGPDNKFSFTSYNSPKELILLQDCPRNVSSSKNYKAIKCKENDDDHTLYAVYKEDFNQEEVGKCYETVVVPYEKEEDDRIGIQGLLTKGIIVEYSANNCSVCQNSGGRCGFGQNTSRFFCFCPDRDHTGRCHPHPPKGKHLGTIFGSVFSGLGAIIILVLIICWQRKCIKGSLTFPSTSKIIEDNRNFETLLRNYASLAPKRYTYSDIKKMSNSFGEKLGEGGFGAVYKGKLLDGRLVAVKLLKNTKGDGEGFINEVASIGRTNHVNVVALLGFCYEHHKRALVYEYMENGSLEKFMLGGANNGTTLLPLETLFQIVLGIARGLEYLHRGCKTRILHFDIKPHNILLDKEFCPKISDFGLAKLTPQDKQSKISMSGMRGTVGYIAPEVFCRTFGDVSHKSDVYSYGMMVLEVMGSRKKTDGQVQSSSDLYFPEYIYKELEHEEGVEMDENGNQLKRKMTVVSLWCIQPIPSSRPSMSRVVQMLEGSPESIDVPPMPALSSPPRLQWDPSTSSSTTL